MFSAPGCVRQLGEAVEVLRDSLGVDADAEQQPGRGGTTHHRIPQARTWRRISAQFGDCINDDHHG